MDEASPAIFSDDEFERLEMVTVTYDNQRPDGYEAGTYTGIVLARRPNGRRILLIYGTGETECLWFEFYASNRWIDKAFATIVTAEEATPSKRDELRRSIAPEKLKRLVMKEVEKND